MGTYQLALISCHSLATYSLLGPNSISCSSDIVMAGKSSNHFLYFALAPFTITLDVCHQRCMCARLWDCCFSGVTRRLLDNFVFLPRRLCARPWDCDNGYGLHYSICYLHIALRVSRFFSPSTLANPRYVGRALRNGKKYAEFINDAIVVGAFAVHDMITRYASGPQDESDADSDGEDDDDFDAVATSPARSPTSSQPTPPAQPATGSRSLPLLTLLRQRWQLSSSSPLPQSAPAILTCKEKKKTRNCTACATK